MMIREAKARFATVSGQASGHQSVTLMEILMVRRVYYSLILKIVHELTVRTV